MFRPDSTCAGSSFISGSRKTFIHNRLFAREMFCVVEKPWRSLCRARMIAQQRSCCWILELLLSHSFFSSGDSFFVNFNVICVDSSAGLTDRRIDERTGGRAGKRILAKDYDTIHAPMPRPKTTAAAAVPVRCVVLVALAVVVVAAAAALVVVTSCV